MKRFLKIGILVLVIGLMLFKTEAVQAAGDLNINYHVPLGDPIFVVENFLPGDSENRDIDITNNGSVARAIWVKGIRTGGVGGAPKLETVIDIVIKDGATPIYGTGSPTGPKTVQNFFTDSSGPTGVSLGTINSGVHKTFNFKVTFPTSAGNEFQRKSVIFDLKIPNFQSDNIVINEVYYRVDSLHGLDSPKDRGILNVNGNNVTVVVSGNGEGSNNTVNVSQSEACRITQSNNANVSTNINSNSNTGGNSIIGNVISGIISIITGNASSFTSVTFFGNINSSNSDCGKKLGQNDEWVELYNPTDHDISLKNWKLTDNHGTRVINANKTIKAGGFAIISKSASTWNFWNENPSAVKVELGGNIGDGLDNTGDHLILKNPSSSEIDRMSWGIDTSGFSPPATNPLVPLGSSTERLTPGFDTNVVTDWEAQTPPAPGN
ncbi:MAG: lamin tail domain-containing protein [Patescibacteria group bacterium]